MTNNIKTWVAMTATAVAVPVSDDRAQSADRQIVGIGMFIAEHGDEPGQWTFSRYGQTYVRGKEDDPLEAIADRLPPDATLIGWHIDHALMPTLLAASENAPSTIKHHFSARLYRLVRRGVIDMALCQTWGRGRRLSSALRAAEISASVIDGDAMMTAWLEGTLDKLDADLADEALALWRLFVRAAGLPGVDAERATDAWLTAGRVSSKTSS